MLIPCRKHRQVQATQQKLQTLNLAIDANESHARKLESDLNVKTDQCGFAKNSASS